ncbi:alpha-L-fucosidase [Maribellus comscasis]|uniref:alpha-L-fucosidase n=1 Tax=Maribellus comscasis TaxID=2681766 RepID=A0A6I6K262_9BACT|nr:alpha-L-fucosidase [Maribellus comscasis]QGY46522.1 alpha-L-fucosidase [Maribellus comscasis]
MKNKMFYYPFFFLLMLLAGCDSNKEEKKAADIYQPTWESLEKVNPVPEWFKDAKFGIYFHWGVYSVPAFANEWYPKNMYGDNSRENKHHKEVYGDPVSEWPYHYFIQGAKDKRGNWAEFAPKLKSDGGEFDPAEWAQLFADAGARFAGPVAEHHDGFSMWDSKVNPWNAKDKGPEMDLVKVLADAIREKNMKLILSMHHAYNITGFYEHVPKTDDPELQKLYGQLGKEKNEEVWLEKHKEIIDNYQPDIIWQDFNLTEITDSVLLQFVAYYYNSANKWNKEVVNTYKDALNTDVAVLDYERGGPFELKDYYWLTDDAISRSSWCYTEGIAYYSAKAVLHSLFDRISKNGNLLLNISPKADGSIPQKQKDILLAMGNWLKKNGEAVYSTRAWVKFGEGPTEMGSGHPHGEGATFTTPVEGTSDDIRFTRSKDNKTLYAIVLGWPEDNTVTVESLAQGNIDLASLQSVSLLNHISQVNLEYNQEQDGLRVVLPAKQEDEMAYVIKFDFDGEIPGVHKTAEK